MPDIIAKVDFKQRREIEKYLVGKRGCTINQIAEDLGISWATARKHLDDMETVGRVHKEQIGSSTAYFLNDQGKWNRAFKLNNRHYIFIDSFISPFGQPFIRIKDTKKRNGKWEPFGDVMITKDKLKDVIGFLKEVSKNVEKM